ncbi:AlpA family phage regulatory protein [Providencia alcalifaciens]|uniref:helix-turn-helix transcriptional regulator n=1 Tax=Providencia sp. wls1921 TaxID=2675153 RepID=UPI001E2C2547|nr:AlpA family phage regulatory protein [Providencia sp. wls1921]
MMNSSIPNNSISTSPFKTIEQVNYNDTRYILIDIKKITQLIGMTDKWIYSLIQKQAFPKPIKMGRSSRWRLSDIEQWIDEQAIAK